MIEDGPITAREDGFRLIQHGHRDMVSAVAFNSYGDRFASTSVDGKIKVYNRHRDGSWNVCDTWGAHNAEILQVAPSIIHIKAVEANIQPLRCNGSPQPSTPTS